MYTYCLFCETVKCVFVAYAARALYGCETIQPKQIQHTWEKGRMTDRERDLLPGYLFVYSDHPLNATQLRYLPGAIRCLRSSEKVYELTGADEAFALMLYQKNGVIGRTPVYQEDQRIRLAAGAFAGLDATVRKVDRRARRMQIEIPFTHRLVRTWVEYEIVSPEEESLPGEPGERKENPDGE